MTITPTLAFTLRHPTLDDVPVITQQINAVHFHDTGVATIVTEERMRALWDAPGIDIPGSVYLAHTPDNQVVGFDTCIGLPPFEEIETEMTILPEWRGQGVEEILLQTVIDHAMRVHIPQADPHSRIVLKASADERAIWQNQFLQAHAFQLVRGFWKMQIDFDSALPTPTWADGLELRPYDPATQDHLVYAAVMDAFAEHWGFHPVPFEQWDFIMRRECPDPTLWFNVWSGDEIAGLAICTTDRPDTPDLGYVADLGVRRNYRKLGLGLALLHHAFGEFKQRGKKGASLHVDSENMTGATRLYERAGMHVVETSWKYHRVLREATTPS
ncbi:MAG: GNAT family N-acetyltransferase [Chloroflexi bacterium]|nr:GNAT family N-acetyltransferase [Chloroflexota bacterium]